MTPPIIIEDAVAIVPVADMAVSLAFYEEILGFQLRFLADDKKFATVVLEGATLHLTETDDAGSLLATSQNISVYIWVKNVDGLYEQLYSKLNALPSGQVRALFNQPYGMREFHVKDPDGCLLFFGENCKKA